MTSKASYGDELALALTRVGLAPVIEKSPPSEDGIMSDYREQMTVYREQLQAAGLDMQTLSGLLRSGFNIKKFKENAAEAGIELAPRQLELLKDEGIKETIHGAKTLARSMRRYGEVQDPETAENGANPYIQDLKRQAFVTFFQVHKDHNPDVSWLQIVKSWQNMSQRDNAQRE